MNYHKLFKEIQASFPEASHISINITTSQKEIDRINEEFMATLSDGIMIQDHGMDEKQFVHFKFPYLGDINLTHNGS